MIVSIQDILLIWVGVIFAAVLRTFTGFGFALAVVPMLSLMLPPGDVLVLGAALALALGLLSLRQWWGQVALTEIVPLTISAALGTVIGALFLPGLSAAWFQLGAGASIILACAGIALVRPSRPLSSPALTGVSGLASGLMNGVLAIPGPPVVVYMLLTEPNPARSRALLMMFFTLLAVVALGSYGVAGLFNTHVFLYFLLACPALWIGDLLGGYLFRRFGGLLYRRVAILTLLAMGVVIAFKALLPFFEQS